ncbi:MAG TPA: hypothetical protein VK756_08525 [Solirubrobacteraceae bacterium]|jgi:hypothetical protein|nr:hypothetical protein [Solirubrobacteraceae bacterium]
MSDHLLSHRSPTSDLASGASPAADGAPGAPPPDVSLLLRAHAERRWLSREVIPVLRQIETSIGLPDEQLPAAIAYLEVIWAEALSRARETDAEGSRLDTHGHAEQPLLARARRYHAVVRDLRETVTRRVARLLESNIAIRL